MGKSQREQRKGSQGLGGRWAACTARELLAAFEGAHSWVANWASWRPGRKQASRLWEGDLDGAVHICHRRLCPSVLGHLYFDNLFGQGSVSLGSVSLLPVK